MKVTVNKEYKNSLVVKALLSKINVDIDNISKVNFVDSDVVFYQIFSNEYANYSMSFLIENTVVSFNGIGYKIEMVEKADFIFWIGAYGLYFFKNTLAFKKRVKNFNEKLIKKAQRKVNNRLGV